MSDMAVATPESELAKFRLEKQAALERDASEAIVLRAIIKDTLWMAQRYADGRMTYAVEMYNDAAKIAERLGFEVTYAKDGMFDADTPSPPDAPLS